jgi:hypothetical protein
MRKHRKQHETRYSPRLCICVTPYLSGRRYAARAEHPAAYDVVDVFLGEAGNVYEQMRLR